MCYVFMECGVGVVVRWVYLVFLCVYIVDGVEEVLCGDVLFCGEEVG